jgi:hypothetical protein
MDIETLMKHTQKTVDNERPEETDDDIDLG